MSNLIDRLEALPKGWQAWHDHRETVTAALPDLLKLARAAWELRDAERRFLAYPPQRAARIEAAEGAVDAALEPLFREVQP